jgi:A/G-specific adenine glycosylase
MNDLAFADEVWQKGRELYRDMPWRQKTDAYSILVSELMLQQTQVDRVIPKFNYFMEMFPTIRDLAAAPLANVLTTWSGLGYNRRAKYLHEAAKKIAIDFHGTIPDSYQRLVSLPGIGPNTAGAILAYSFNKPIVFIETNIRTVYFYHYFEDQSQVTDSELREVVERTIDHEHPREWYWAMMDYGSSLKKQAPLKGSLREIRGQILKILAVSDLAEPALAAQLPDDERYEMALNALLKESLVARTDDRLHLMR